MPRKRASPRPRRASIVAVAAAFGVLSGLDVLIQVAIDSHPAGSQAGIVVGVGLVVGGGAALWWSIRDLRGTTAAPSQPPEADENDGLPPGAFRDGQRIGPEGSDALLVVAGFFTVFGLVFLVVALLQRGVLVVGLGTALGLGFLPAVLLVRAARGTRLWLTPGGIERERWPRKSLPWTEVTRIVTLQNGARAPLSAVTDYVQLRVTAPSRHRRSSRDRTGFAVRVMLLHVSAVDLVRLIQGRLPAPVPVYPPTMDRVRSRPRRVIAGVLTVGILLAAPIVAGWLQARQ